MSTSTYVLKVKISDDCTLEIKNKLFEYYSKLSAKYQGDSGVDILNPVAIDNTMPLDVAVINFRIQCAMFNLETNKYTSYLLLPRSSLSNTPFMLANSVGLIDAGYRGYIMAKVRNMSLNNIQTSLEGRYFQIVSPDLSPIRVEVVDELPVTDRGDSGFGSTGN